MTSVQALMGFIAGVERISRTIQGPAFTRFFVDENPDEETLVSPDDLRDVVGSSFDEDVSITTQCDKKKRRESFFRPTPVKQKQEEEEEEHRRRSKGSAGGTQKRLWPPQQNTVHEDQLMMYGLPLKRWLLKQLSVVKLQAYGSLAAMRIMFPAELRVIHTTLAAEIALDYMRTKVRLLAEQGMISHHTCDDVLEIIKQRHEKMLRYRLQYKDDTGQQ